MLFYGKTGLCLLILLIFPYITIILIFFPELKGSPESKKIKRSGYEKILVSLVKSPSIRRILKRVAKTVGYDYLEGGEFLKIPADHFIPKEKFGNATRLYYGLFLQKYKEEKFVAMKISKEDLVEAILETLKNEWEATLPICNFLNYFDKTKVILSKTLDGLETYQILMPASMDSRERLQNLEYFLKERIFYECKT